MSEPIVWENLPKSQADATTIDEAISDAIEVHNADSEAHMAALASLAAHRDNAILDHPAESVYNDKLTVRARAYVAIVDASSPADYDTIEAAIAYATTAGGGTILITQGDHYLSTVVDVPSNINLEGIDRDTTKIHGNKTAGQYLRWPNTATFEDSMQYFRRLQFVNDGGGVIEMQGYAEENIKSATFEDCIFSGGGTYVVQAPWFIYFTRCQFYCSATYAVGVSAYVYADACNFTTENGQSGCTIFTNGAGRGSSEEGFITNCRFEPGSSTNNKFFGTQSWFHLVVSGCRMNYAYFTDIGAGGMRFMGNYILLYSTSYINVTTDGNYFSGNTLTGGSGNRLRFATGADRNVAIGNIVGTSITNSGANNQIANNVLV